MAELDDLFGDLEGFEWDAGNSDKHWVRHQVRQSEAEHALLNTPVVVKATTKHGSTEQRFVTLGWRRPRLRVHPARPQVGLCNWS